MLYRQWDGWWWYGVRSSSCRSLGFTDDVAGDRRRCILHAVAAADTPAPHGCTTATAARPRLHLFTSASCLLPTACHYSQGSHLHLICGTLQASGSENMSDTYPGWTPPLSKFLCIRHLTVSAKALCFHAVHQPCFFVRLSGQILLLRYLMNGLSSHSETYSE